MDRKQAEAIANVLLEQPAQSLLPAAVGRRRLVMLAMSGVGGLAGGYIASTIGEPMPIGAFSGALAGVLLCFVTRALRQLRRPN